jgi:hypothetical protein
MTTWAWIGVGMGASLAASLVFAVVVAQMLRAVGSEASQLFEEEWYRSAPLTRETEAVPVATISRTRGSSSQAAH